MLNIKYTQQFHLKSIELIEERKNIKKNLKLKSLHFFAIHNVDFMLHMIIYMIFHSI